MLDPAGNARNPGRIIGKSSVNSDSPGTFERTCTTFFANQLKKMLEKKDKNIMVLFTRLPGEYINQIEKAHFANQCNVDLFCHICTAHTHTIQPQIYIYHAQIAPLALKDNTLFFPLDRAHEPAHTTTTDYAWHLHRQLQKNTRICNVSPPVSCPLTPLKGVKSPALCIEIGIKQIDDLAHVLEPFADALYQALREKHE